jgi:hypothetical protein
MIHPLRLITRTAPVWLIAFGSWSWATAQETVSARPKLEEFDDLEKNIHEIERRLIECQVEGKVPPEALIRQAEELRAHRARMIRHRESEAELEKLRMVHREVKEEIEGFEADGRKPPAELERKESELLALIRRLESGRPPIPPDEQVLKALKELNPPEAEDLAKLQEAEPREFREIVERLLPWIEEMKDLQQRDPKLFELEKTSHQINFACERLAEDARRAKGEKRDVLAETLRGKLSELFGVRIDIRKYHIQQLEKELKELRAQVEKMTSQADSMIDRRLQRMLFTGEEEW